MSEVIIKDSSIKLFGQIISLPLPPSDNVDSFATSSSQDSKDESRYDSTWSGHEHESVNPMKEKSSDAATSSDISDESNSPKKDDESSIKKPDKIIPCPRCESMDTKFCYYNNHNVNQPRHLCKNCQRYWTSGGTMRSVPVGSGRRKTKNQTNGFVFYPATLYWGSAVPSLNTSPASTSCLGKHSREGPVIHDPSEVAKSSIWSTLGIKKGKNGFKGFELNGVDHRAMVLKANPAALSRSLNFHDD